jgi:hypothetical protein
MLLGDDLFSNRERDNKLISPDGRADIGDLEARLLE